MVLILFYEINIEHGIKHYLEKNLNVYKKKNYSSIKEKVTRIKWLTFIFIFFEKSTI